jgi:P4 family phage/plasmid primase-like protien
MSSSQSGWFRYWMPEKEQKWIKIADTHEARQEALNQGAMFFTWAALDGNPDNGSEPLRRGPLVIDLDDKENPKNAFNEAKLIINYLGKVYGVDPHQIHISLSGSKGIHLEIDLIILGATPGPYLPLEYKRIVSKIMADLDLKSVDSSIYSMGQGKMFRLHNVQRKNGRHKVPIMLSELTALSDEELISLTKQPRYLDPDDQPEDPVESELLRDLFLECREEIQKEMLGRQDHKPIGKDELKKLGVVPACIAAILNCEHHTDKINFNKLCLNLACFCVDAGFSLEESETLVEPLIAGYKSQSYPTESDRRKHFQGTYTYVKGIPAYGFSCGYILGLGLSGSLFDCGQCQINPERKPTRAELEEKIKQTDDPDILTKDILRDIITAKLTQADTHRLFKLIAKKAGCTVKDLKADAEKLLPSPEELQLEYARTVIEVIGPENIITDNQGIHTWSEKGVWQKTDDRLIKKNCHNVMPMDEISKNTVESVVDLIKTETFKPNHRWEKDTNGINCLNGELYFNGNSWELRPHCREHYRTTQIPVSYDPEARAERFKKFLNEVFEGDGDELLKTSLVCEMLGYALMTTAKYEKFFILFGNGANGKSVILDVLVNLVGREHASSVEPSTLSNSFYRAHLFGKLINVISELKAGSEIADDYLKKISSGEITTADQKFKPPFEFYPFCTCIFATNHFPSTKDFSDALYRRALIIEFNRTFAPEEQNANLKDELKNELPGILNLALEGICNVMSTGRFQSPKLVLSSNVNGSL